MKAINILTLPFAAALLLASSLVSASPAGSSNTQEVASATQQASNNASNTVDALVNQIQPRKPGQCFSAKNCTGKVIGNHQHAHNCKNAGGKSWRSGVTGQCSNL
ncbi:hypothetical protein JW897_10685 [Chromobacterium alkanivorans]|uniref:hypothetical protein n=1 Tax=Chromobacterium alkanivorans TaxID=1071719 RepID=UPI0019673F86|nr:hypothetical protein [Chromobacterium alkanivorans]MBN3004200.1 hypothetical protein [Chromobacterium alkanivorans]